MDLHPKFLFNKKGMQRNNNLYHMI